MVEPGRIYPDDIGPVESVGRVCVSAYGVDQEVWIERPHDTARYFAGVADAIDLLKPLAGSRDLTVERWPHVLTTPVRKWLRG